MKCVSSEHGKCVDIEHRLGGEDAQEAWNLDKSGFTTPGSFRKKQTFRKSEFEMLESCAKDEHLIESGDTAMNATS